MKKTFFACFLLLSSFGCFQIVSAGQAPWAIKPNPDTAQNFFYKGYDFGSQAMYGPFDVIMNGGFGILQVSPDFYNRKIMKYPYNEWWRNTWENVGDPITAIKKEGVHQFLKTEIIPTSIDPNKMQWFPNYFLHIIGAGSHSRALEEWFAYHQYPFPRAWSIATMTTYHSLTEIVENQGYRGVNTDPVADMCFFDPLGIMVFWNDDVCRFFSHTLRLTQWSLQPSFNWTTGNLENMGQTYVMRYPVPFTSSWDLMGQMGLHCMAGLSRRIGHDRGVSILAGLESENLEKSQQISNTRLFTAQMTWCMGIYYDIDNSLMMSLTFTGIRHNLLRLNMYPGSWRLGPLHPGCFVAYTGELVTGFSLTSSPIGFAASSGQ
jgi:hypothetical protein